MKMALTTLVLTAAFLGAGLGVLKAMAPAAPEADAAPAGEEATAGCAPDSATVAPLAADLDAMQARLDAAIARGDSLRRIMDLHQETADAARTDAAELASTLTKMEDEALRSIVQKLDGRSFVTLYAAASGRNQGRLLGALTSAQAAAFVRTQLPGGSTPVRSTSTREVAATASDSTDA